MTTLKLSELAMHGASIADPQPRAELSVVPIGQGPVDTPEPTAVNATAVEYQVIYVARPMAGEANDGVETDLNRAAGEGWRLVGSLTNDEARTTGLIMERHTSAAGV